MSLFDTAGATHVGRVRKNNEDSYVICNGQILLAAVADGIGGHAHGEIASMLCCTGLAAKFNACKDLQEYDSAKTGEQLCSWIEEVNSSIFERNKAEKNPLPMGSTLCAAIFTEQFTVCANVGDSRLYCLDEDRELLLLTHDHTVRHNGGNFLSRAVGIVHKARPDVFVFKADISDRYVLVSDGIYNSLSENEIAEILAAGTDAGTTANEMIKRANECGGVDNLTVAAVFRR